MDVLNLLPVPVDKQTPYQNRVQHCGYCTGVWIALVFVVKVVAQSVGRLRVSRLCVFAFAESIYRSRATRIRAYQRS